MTDFYKQIERILKSSNLEGDYYTRVLEALKNGGGGDTPGKDGREVELVSDGTNILWRYVGTSSWFPLVPLSDLKGDKGDDVDPTVVNSINTRLDQVETSVGNIVPLMEVL